MQRAIGISAALALGGCTQLLGVDEFHTSGGGDDDAGMIDARVVDAMVPPEVAARYVVSDVTIPTTNVESEALGRDLDDDGTVDNQLGMIFSALQSSGGEDLLGVFQADAAIAAGDAIWLHELYAYELVDSSAAWWASYDGEPESPPDYTGNGVFAVDQTAPTDGRIDGTIVGGAFLGEHGTGRFVLGVGTGVVRVDLRAAEVAATVSSDACDGVIAGGIPDEDIQNRVIPAMAMNVQQMLADDPGCPGSCSETSMTLLNLFDADGDGMITVEEFRTTSLIETLMRPDVDLVGGDGEADSLSVGVGITCVRASFATP